MSWASGLRRCRPGYVDDTTPRRPVRAARLAGYLDILAKGTTTSACRRAAMRARALADKANAFEAAATARRRTASLCPSELRAQPHSAAACPRARRGRSARHRRSRSGPPRRPCPTRFPGAGGPHRGDTIVSAEAALDRRLGGALSRRQALGLYPGTAQQRAVLQPARGRPRRRDRGRPRRGTASSPRPCSRPGAQRRSPTTPT